jgi:hypothetical protein
VEGPESVRQFIHHMKTMVYRFFTPNEIEANTGPSITSTQIVRDIQNGVLEAAFEVSTGTYRVSGMALAKYLYTVPHNLDLSYGV